MTHWWKIVLRTGASLTPYELLTFSHSSGTILLLMLINHVDENQCGSWSAGFIRSQMIWIYTDFKRGHRNLIKLCILCRYVRYIDCCIINRLLKSVCLFELILYIPSTIFLSWTSTKLGLMCLAQGHNAKAPVRLEPAAPLSLVKHSTTEL